MTKGTDKKTKKEAVKMTGGRVPRRDYPHRGGTKFTDDQLVANSLKVGVFTANALALYLGVHKQTISMNMTPAHRAPKPGEYTPDGWLSGRLAVFTRATADRIKAEREVSKVERLKATPESLPACKPLYMIRPPRKALRVLGVDWSPVTGEFTIDGKPAIIHVSDTGFPMGAVDYQAPGGRVFAAFTEDDTKSLVYATYNYHIGAQRLIVRTPAHMDALVRADMWENGDGIDMSNETQEPVGKYVELYAEDPERYEQFEPLWAASIEQPVG